ncbi:MAG: LPS-assembly protein LptD [Bacteroidales bacterium]|nr:LPS-assembly protein LptD [Bacteroidales bacterium]
MQTFFYCLAVSPVISKSYTQNKVNIVRFYYVFIAFFLVIMFQGCKTSSKINKVENDSIENNAGLDLKENSNLNKKNGTKIGGNNNSSQISLDSIAVFSNDSLPLLIDSTSVLDTTASTLDSTEVLKDTIMENIPPKKTSSNAIDKPIDYHGYDSTIMDVKNKIMKLYGDAYIIYGTMELNAEYIEVDLKNSILYAYGIEDSTGNVVGKPHFKETNEEFTADTIKYNIKTKIGKIKNVMTQQGEGFLHMNDSKRLANSTVCMKGGKYTTCSHEHPHFYIHLTKAKVIPDDKIVSGRAFMVIEDVPIPFPQLPFGFFPNHKKQTSGLLIPEYGQEQNRGFFLRNGGWYFAINDHLDLDVRGEIFTLGSWGLSTAGRYKKNYKFSGNLSANYRVLSLGEKALAEIPSMYSRTEMYSIQWKHRQDPKARPNSNFTANVDYSSSAYDKYHTYGTNRFASNKQSSISYNLNIPNSPFNLSANLNHSQNANDSIVSMGLPQVNFNMSRIYPFKRKIKKSKPAFYEKIGISYSTNFKNNISARQDSIFSQQTLDNMKTGFKHSVPVSSSFNLFKYLTISPNANYTNRMYMNRFVKYWQDSLYNPTDSSYYGQLVTARENGFFMLHEYNYGASLSTKIYGMVNFKSETLKAIRHIITPSLSYRFQPDYSREILYGNYIDGNSDTIEYSYYQNSLYGMPSVNRAQLYTFSVNNNLEMKLKNKNDTSATDRKVKLIESLSASSSYNALAKETDSLFLSPIQIAFRTTIKSININASATVDPYWFDEDLNKVVPVYVVEQTGKLGRLTRAQISTGFTLRSKPNSKEKEKQAKLPNDYLNYYVDFDIPWSLNFSYSFVYSKPRMEKTITQTLTVNGDISLTKKWKITATSGYDFVKKNISYTTVNIIRDLHCWEMRFNWVPFGPFRSYNFQINAKASMLQDLKLTRRRSWHENF